VRELEANMATTFVPGNGDGIRPYGRCKVKHFPMAASQTFKRGYPLILDAASNENRVRVASNDPTAAIVGIAAADASACITNSDGTTTTGGMVPVWLAQPELKFIGRTIASVAVDFTMTGVCKALEAHASLNIWVVDIGDSGADSVVVEFFENPNSRTLQTAEGDFEVNVVFHFDPKATIFGAGT
jgi:hypothetical protein